MVFWKEQLIHGTEMAKSCGMGNIKMGNLREEKSLMIQMVKLMFLIKFMM
jgi:hypothetical protein